MLPAKSSASTGALTLSAARAVKTVEKIRALGNIKEAWWLLCVSRVDQADMPANNTPLRVILASPYPGIAEGAVRDVSGDVHGKLSTQRGDSNVCTQTANVEFFRDVFCKFDSTRALCFNILRL